ncbi:ABC transporter-related protein [Nostoc carneum NIES-2107]|nr:ABC transporter-related protein [Nostoc carneum NIES-2107]
MIFSQLLLQRNKVRTPIILQMEAVECGAASLGIILSYYGRIVPLAKLREECSISRDGSKAFNIIQVARSYGLNAKGLKLPLEKLQTLHFPYIIFWNFNHFLVVEGIGKKRVYLNDPATGRRSISLDEFNKAYTGVVLRMEPGENFHKGGKRTNIISALISRLKNSWGTILFCLLAGLLLTIPRLAVPGFSQVFVDEILIQERQEWLRPLLLGMLLTAVLRALLAKLRLTYLRRLMVKLSVSMSGNFLWHILRLPVGFYAQRYAGEISSRVQINDTVAEILSGRLATTVIDAVMMVFYLLIMIQYNSLLSAIAVGFAVINILALQLISQTRVDANFRLAQEYGKVFGVAVSGIQTIETVKASGLESDLFAKFAGYYAKALNAQQELGLQTQILTTLPTILTALTTASILVVGGLEVMNGKLSIGMLVAYQSLTLSFLEPVNSLLNFGSTLQDLEASLNRLDDVLQNPIDPQVEQDKLRNQQIRRWEEVHTSASKADVSPSEAQVSPLKAQASPSKAQALPSKADASPLKAQVSPSKAQALPSKADASPLKAQVSPSKADGSPSKAQVSPSKAHTSPSEVQISPSKAQVSPFKADISPILYSPKLHGYIELRNVTFGYNRLEPPLIENLSLTVKPGERIAFVGKSGSGKSTIAKLICGLYEPWEGEIYFDGIPRQQIPRSVLANSVAMVEQDIFLFAGTIRENLTLWDATVPEVDLIQACEDAAINDLILSLPNKFDAELIEGGMNISGGQRQRLEIARALIKNPQVLVLDEATSALDAETELIIDQNLRRRGCSCMVIAHRLSTIRDCHEIIVLDRGKIAERGTHQELWDLGGIYARLIQTEEA